MALSTKVLLNLPDAAVKTFVNSQFVNQLKCSKNVKRIFFSDSTEAVPPQDPNFVDNLATAFVCSSIARSSLYGFAACINKSAADGYWKNGLADGNLSAIKEGQALYNWAFPAYCHANGTKFKDFLENNPSGWAEKLAAFVTTAPFIDTTINKMFAEPGWLDALNLIFYKIDQLDSSKSARVLDVWQKAYPKKSIMKNWDQRNFIPQSNFASIPEAFLGVVNEGLSEKNNYTESVGEQGIRHITYPVYGSQIAYAWLGVPIPEFLYDLRENDNLNHNTLVRKLGFLSGTSPANIGEGKSACFVAGTSVRLEDGRSIPIEKVSEGDRVLGQGGGISVKTKERVEINFPDGVDVFGFELKDCVVDPFFYAGHMFWTTNGWKALDPEIALMENPERHVEQLMIGDYIFRLKPDNEDDYEKIEILGFNKKRFQKNAVLHGLHLLEGPRSFHANGYLVAMNYPVITAGRLQDGFSRLTFEERNFVKKQLIPVLPMLDAAIGNFVTDTILTTLSEDNS